MSNYSGFEHVVTNTRERAVSNDINNAAKASAKQIANRQGRWIGTSYPEYTAAGSSVHGFDVAPTQNATPLQSDVYGGLRVRPFSSFFMITAGTVGAWTNVGGIDSLDSSYSLIDDPGVQTSTTMIFTANAGPGIRVDVVEFSIQSVVLTQESRDIFDPTTGLFTAAFVPKRVASQLAYRTRLGTQGAGYPGHAAGYLPIAVIITPAGATSFDDCAFYDVRPLVSDRIDGCTKSSYADASQRVLHASNAVDAATGIIQGFYSIDGDGASAFDTHPYRAQGHLRSTVPGASDTLGIALNSAVNWANGMPAFAGTQWGYVVALFPEGLPRWVKYSTFITPDGERLPMNTMGIMTVCQGPISACASTSGLVILPPLSTGLTTAAGGVLAAAFIYSTSGGYAQNIAPTFRTSNGVVRLRDAADNASMFVNGVQTLANASIVHLDYDMGNVGQITGKVPFTTISMKWAVGIGYTLTLSARFRFTWQVKRGGVLIYQGPDRYKTLNTSGAFIIDDEFEFTLPNSTTAGGTPGTSGNVIAQLEIFETNLAADGFVATFSGIHLVELTHGVF
jgi:hypothetical protein